MSDTETLRSRIIDISVRHKLSHIGSCLTALPIIEEIYAIKKPEDKFVLSSGHAHLAHAVILGQTGGPDPEKSIMEWGIHCDRRAGCDVSTGSLGQGLPIAVGLALADKSNNIYCLVSDGEMAEGSIWESLRIARDLQLTNLKVYINMNEYGAYDRINTFDLERQIKGFGFPVEIRHTDPGLGAWARGLQAHYKVADGELK